jgi:4-hydroxy-2-oxoglutarate aldolase
MARLGADAALVVTPSYFKGRMTPAALEAHFRQVADAAPVPVILYNVPANTGVDLPAVSAIRLSAHPNIIGLKDSSGDLQKMGLVIREADPRFAVLAGSAGYFLPALALGAVGCIGALANFAARPLQRMMDCLRAGALDESRAIQLRLIEANLAVTARFGVAGLKAALELCGRPAGVVRAPLLPLDAEETATLRAILVRAGVLGG